MRLHRREIEIHAKYPAARHNLQRPSGKRAVASHWLLAYSVARAMRLCDGGVFPFVWLHSQHAGTTSGHRLRLYQDVPFPFSGKRSVSLSGYRRNRNDVIARMRPSVAPGVIERPGTMAVCVTDAERESKPNTRRQ